MMIRFDFRQKWTSMGLAVVMATGMMLSVPQTSFANDWVDMLKPLVKDVIVPGATMGMKKLMQREERLHPELAKVAGTAPVGTTAPSTTTTTTTTATVNTSGTDEFFTASGSTSSGPDNSFASPEEPISSSNVGGSAGADFWSASHSASSTDPAPAPPPPVATP